MPPGGLIERQAINAAAALDDCATTKQTTNKVARAVRFNVIVV